MENEGEEKSGEKGKENAGTKEEEEEKEIHILQHQQDKLQDLHKMEKKE